MAVAGGIVSFKTFRTTTPCFCMIKKVITIPTNIEYIPVRRTITILSAEAESNSVIFPVEMEIVKNSILVNIDEQLLITIECICLAVSFTTKLCIACMITVPARRSIPVKKSELDELLLAPFKTKTKEPKRAITPPKIKWSSFIFGGVIRSEEHTSELKSHHEIVCRLLLEKKKKK